MGGFCKLLDKLFPNFTDNTMKLTLIISSLILLIIILVKVALWLDRQEEKELKELRKSYKKCH
jgi:FtsZ-interacting cell division protein ZipA